MTLKTKYYSLVAVAALTGVGGCYAQQRPNVIVIMTDDMGSADISPMPHLAVAHTPNIARLAERGVTCTQAYASAPMSLPSRVGLLTGCYPAHNGAYKVDSVQGLPQEGTTLGEYMHEGGYATAMIGKWHAGGEFVEWQRPENRGFERTFYWHDSTHDYWSADTGRTNTWGAVGYAPIYNQGTPIEDYDTGYLTTDIAKHTLDFVDANHQHPFFLYVCHHCSHRPLQVSRELYDKYAELGHERGLTASRAMYEVLDDFVGQLLDKLDGYGIGENTLIIFASDNGGGETDGQLNNTCRGGKFTLSEGGLRVPMIVSWPKEIPTGRIFNRPVVNLDFLPTIISAAGIAPQQAHDGVNLLPYLQGQKVGAPHEVLCWTNGDEPDYESEGWSRENTPELFGYPFEKGDFAVRKGDWKLVSTVGCVGLFNLREDAGEMVDRSADHPEIYNDLLNSYKEWAKGLTQQSYDPQMIQTMKTEQQKVAPLKGTYKYNDIFGEKGGRR